MCVVSPYLSCGSPRQKYLNQISPSSPSSRHPTRKFIPPYGLTFASFTDDVGVVDTKTKTSTIKAGHMNGYLIIPGTVYHLSTKLQKGVTHNRLRQDIEVKLIEFMTQFWVCNKKITNSAAACRTYTLLLWLRWSTYKDVTVSMVLFLFHCSSYCSTMHASHFDMTEPLIWSYQC